MSIKQKAIIGCVCLMMLLIAFWIAGPKPSAPGVNPPAVTDTSPVVTYTFEQQQAAFKAWRTEFEVKTSPVNEQWNVLNKILEDTEQEEVYSKLDEVLQNFEKLEGTYSSLQPPKELSIEHQKILQQVSRNMDDSISARIKYIKLTEGYMLHQRALLYRQSEQQKELIDLYQSASSSEIKKLSELLKVE